MGFIRGQKKEASLGPSSSAPKGREIGGNQTLSDREPGEWGEARARGKDGETEGGFTVSPPALAEVTVMKGVEVGEEEGREEKMTPLTEEEEERSSADEEAPESHWWGYDLLPFKRFYGPSY